MDCQVCDVKMVTHSLTPQNLTVLFDLLIHSGSSWGVFFSLEALSLLWLYLTYLFLSSSSQGLLFLPHFISGQEAEKVDTSRHWQHFFFFFLSWNKTLIKTTRHTLSFIFFSFFLGYSLVASPPNLCFHMTSCLCGLLEVVRHWSGHALFLCFCYMPI